MATGTIYNDREWLSRLQALTIDGGTHVLLNIFDQRVELQNVPLHIFLANEKKSINRLREGKTITTTQYNHLYPPGGQLPHSKDFDIVLIICLLRHLPSLGLNQKYSWNVPPQPADTSVEADLCRLKGFRDEIAHISSTTGFQQESFETKWTDIEQVLLRLNQAVRNPIPNLKQKIDSYKDSSLDPVADKRVQADIEQWRKMERGLETKMQMTKKGLEDIMEYRADNLLEMKEETKEDELRKELQDDLISFYRSRHSKITLSPLVDEDTPLLKFYVMPDIKSVEVKRARSGGKEIKTLISPFRNVFYKDGKLCNEIYLTAEAGLGKTALCKRLALAWCHAKKPLKHENRYFLMEEIEAMNGFRFVFFLLLRDSGSRCCIRDLILDQIVSELPNSYTSHDIENIMCQDTSLVILDGLDEWTHPLNSCAQRMSSIPHRKVRDCTTVLTTTRPWKLDVSGLKPSEIDKRLEITGLNKKSAHMLQTAVISHLSGQKDEFALKRDVKEFSTSMEETRISDLEVVPLLLMFMLFQWYYGMTLGESRCDIYSMIIESLLSRTVLKYKDTSSLAELTQGDIPQCFTTKKHCRQFYTLLTALGHLAFQMLFMETRKENALVFDSSVAEHYLNKDSLVFCLRTGIITQSKVQGNPMKQESKVSFAHKTVQEFFAALYMHSTPDQTSLSEVVASKCTCIRDILDMSNILVFISGMNVKVASSVSRALMEIINEDEITLEYRSRLDSYTSYNYFSHPLKEFQDMCISCCKEFPHKSEDSLCLQDVFVDESCKQEQYRKHLKQLTTRNRQYIKTVYIATLNSPYDSEKEVIEYFGLHDLGDIKAKYEDGSGSDKPETVTDEKVRFTLLRSRKHLPSGDYLPTIKFDGLFENFDRQPHSNVSELKEGIKEDKMKHGTKCIVCKDRKRSIITLPCRHFVTCLYCRRGESCPLCRTKIEDVYCFQDVIDEENLQRLTNDNNDERNQAGEDEIHYEADEDNLQMSSRESNDGMKSRTDDEERKDMIYLEEEDILKKRSDNSTNDSTKNSNGQRNQEDEEERHHEENLKRLTNDNNDERNQEGEDERHHEADADNLQMSSRESKDGMKTRTYDEEGKVVVDEHNTQRLSNDNSEGRKKEDDQERHHAIEEDNLQRVSNDSDDEQTQEERHHLSEAWFLRKSTMRSLRMGELPDQMLLNELCSKLGRKSKLVLRICTKICEHIKTLDDRILHVWAAYTSADESKVVFVVIVREHIRLEKLIQYSFRKRVENEYSSEANDVVYSGKRYSLDQNDKQNLKESISKNTPELMKRHRYLSVISGSSVRSRNYNKDPNNALELIEETCIVLYVHTKHYIPIDEEPFEKIYDGVPVDVREGEFVPFVHANERQEKLKLGCQIGSSPDRPPNITNVQTGSLGCFIDHPEYSLCALTCAHVLLFHWGLEIVKAEKGVLRWPSFKPRDIVYQPGGSMDAIGQLVQVIYDEGGSNECGIEVALFQIDQRHPDSGTFPEMKNGIGGDMIFDSGKSVGISRISDNECIKFGPKTDRTVGKFEMETNNTSVKTIRHQWDDSEFRITLYKQLSVIGNLQNPTPENPKGLFADHGDSGSLVFIKDSNGELLCAGIVEGGTSYGSTVVTPIKPILEKLGVPKIKSFNKENLWKKIDVIDDNLKTFKNDIMSRLDQLSLQLPSPNTTQNNSTVK